VNNLDAHGLIKSHLLRGRYAAKKSGKSIAFRCPRHNDSTASAWLGDHAWGCSACGFSEGLATLAEILGVDIPVQTGGTGLTLAEYAERKGLALDVLARAGVAQRDGKYGEPIVAIPYRDAEGQTIRTKCRTRKGTFWMADGTGTPLYGQDILAASTGPVLIVEGESDCHAGWQRGLCVVGVPGASLWKPEYALLFSGREVTVWQEPDEGGATLVANVARSLPSARVLKDVTYRGQRVKDLCDLHQAVQSNGESWESAWKHIVDTAVPIGTEPPTVAFDSLSGMTLEHLLEEKLAPVDAVPTMLAGWNTLCRGSGGGVGLARGWFITIGANTGTGKSLVAINLAAQAIMHGETVTFISLEMGRSELATRLLSVVSGESVEVLEQGESFSQDAFVRASLTLDNIRTNTGGHVMVNRRPMSRLSDVEAAIKYHVDVHGSRYFLIDYMQLAYTSHSHSINERIEQVAHRLRELAQQYQIVMVALSQFNRQTSANRGERPVAQGLMGGSAIENDSHQVLLFDHSRFERHGGMADTWLIVDKNRHGSVADLPVRWDYRTLRLETRVPPPETDGWTSRIGANTR
jgi:KaiC/GvpD/RAD55 family RecA-like ATPase